MPPKVTLGMFLEVRDVMVTPRFLAWVTTWVRALDLLANSNYLKKMCNHITVRVIKDIRIASLGFKEEVTFELDLDYGRNWNFQF